MFVVNRLSLKTKEDNHYLIKNLSFTLNPNDKFAIIGSEGSGKSTLLKVLANQCVPFVDVEGHIDISARCAFLDQDIVANWKTDPVHDFLLKDDPKAEPNLQRLEQFGNLSKYFNRVGLAMAIYNENRLINQLSGGEAVKLSLVKLMLSDPEVFLLDEPSNDLDFETVLFLETFILETEKPVLFISHDEALLNHTANGIIHLQRIHKRTDAITTFSKTDYPTYKDSSLRTFDTQMTLAKKQRAEHDKKVKRFRQIYQKVEHQQNQAVREPEKARLLKKKMKSLKSTQRRYTKEEETFLAIPEQEESLNIKFNESQRIPKGKVVLDINIPTLKIGENVLANNIVLTVKGPEKIAIIGRNGIGKSTLLKIIYAQEKRREDIRVGYMPQHYDTLDKASSAVDFLAGHQDLNFKSHVRKMMGAMGFEREEMHATPSELSGGQKAKLYFLNMVIEKTDVILLDEPTRNLSPLSAPEIHQLIQTFKGAVIAVTHDRVFIENVFDKVYELTRNGLILRG